MKWVIFALLKLSEIVGFCLFLIWSSWFGGFIVPEYSFWERIVPGVLMIGAIVALGVLIFNLLPGVIKEIINKNIEWAEKISRGIKK